MNDVKIAYGPSYLGLMGKSSKIELQKILAKYNYPISSFWRMCTTYFQSGMKNYSLINAKSFKSNEVKTYTYKARPGAKSTYNLDNVVKPNEYVIYFEEALNEYKAGREKTLKNAFSRMNIRSTSIL